jgi:hypothetical protein
VTWLLVLAGIIIGAAVMFAASMTFVVCRERRRRRKSPALPAPAPTGAVERVEINEPADCLQVWLDEEWDRKFRRGLSDSSDSVDG